MYLNIDVELLSRLLYLQYRVWEGAVAVAQRFRIFAFLVG